MCALIEMHVSFEIISQQYILNVHSRNEMEILYLAGPGDELNATEP